MRITLYSRLVSEFGPHRHWGNEIKPKGKEDRFTKVIKKLGQEFRVTPWGILDQLNWATTKQREVKDQSAVRDFILNKAAALKAGLIHYVELPLIKMLNEQASKERKSK